MSNSPIIGENVQFRIEVEDNPKSILLVFDRMCEYAIVPWQDAFRLADVMQQVYRDVKQEFTSVDRLTTGREQSQIRLNHHDGLVALLVDWTDRVRFTSIDAFALVAQALRQVSQDCHLAQRGIRFTYDRQGFIKKLHNLAAGYTQEVR